MTGKDADPAPHSNTLSGHPLVAADSIPDNPPSEPTLQAIEAAVFRRLLAHLDSRKDVQNIELMNLAGFCRNCLAKWYRSAADDAGVSLSDAQSRERIYGMPYTEWKSKWQKEASKDQLETFERQTQA